MQVSGAGLRQHPVPQAQLLSWFWSKLFLPPDPSLQASTPNQVMPQSVAWGIPSKPVHLPRFYICKSRNFIAPLAARAIVYSCPPPGVGQKSTC